MKIVSREDYFHGSSKDCYPIMKVLLLDYFLRQSTVKEFGIEGLRRLQDATIAVVGVGGVGSAAAWFLASLGIGRLALIDQDIVEVSNLHRLMGVGENDLNHPKAESVARAIKFQYPWTATIPIVETVRVENAVELLEDSDLVLDGTDNFWTRRILNRFAIRAKTPYLFTSAIANQGHLCMFESPTTPCLECVIPGLESSSHESCETFGVTSSVVGLVGNLAAAEAAKKVLGLRSNLLGQILTIDLVGPDFIMAKLVKREGCQACGPGSRNDDYPVRVVMMCGETTANVLPDKDFSINIPFFATTIPPGQLIASSDSVVVFEKRGHRVSVFKSGRLLINGISNESDALEIASSVWAQVSE